MSEECTHNCDSCGVTCDSREAPTSFLEKLNEQSHVGKVIAVVSGKGGVGKSTVTSLLAVSAAKSGKKVAVLDADITGPSIPTAFGVHQRPKGDENGIYAPESAGGVKVMSINLLLENETDPVVWRGPIIAGTVKQFWTDIVWGDVDYMFVDMPPGTGDVPLTVFQSLPVDGIVVVTTPQDLVSMIVEKAVNMAKMLNIPILGLVENMSWYECPCCGQKLPIFGNSHVEEVAAKFGVANTVSLPLNPTLAAACDKGLVENADVSHIWEFAQKL
jgi:Mrp family chromosome partitioning ATPase